MSSVGEHSWQPRFAAEPDLFPVPLFDLPHARVGGSQRKRRAEHTRILHGSSASIAALNWAVCCRGPTSISACSHHHRIAARVWRLHAQARPYLDARINSDEAALQSLLKGGSPYEPAPVESQRPFSQTRSAFLTLFGKHRQCSSCCRDLVSLSWKTVSSA